MTFGFIVRLTGERYKDSDIESTEYCSTFQYIKRMTNPSDRSFYRALHVVVYYIF